MHSQIGNKRLLFTGDDARKIFTQKQFLHILSPLTVNVKCVQKYFMQNKLFLFYSIFIRYIHLNLNISVLFVM